MVKMRQGRDRGRPQSAKLLAAGDYATLSDFRHVLRQFAAFSKDAALRAGLTTQQHQALLAIKGFPDRQPVTVGALAERLDVRHHSAVGLVDRLAARGLVRRHAGRADRRQVRLGLTPRAEALLARLSVAHRDELRRLAPLLRDLLKRLSAAGRGRY
jgi:DNA-binding MarR family transcriptional regulator